MTDDKVGVEELQANHRKKKQETEGNKKDEEKEFLIILYEYMYKDVFEMYCVITCM